MTRRTAYAGPARAARDALERLLRSDAPALARALPAGFADSAERLVELLLDANSRINLTRVTAPDDVARLHLLDSLSALPLLAGLGPARALDLGSGGGVPGLVLALARPDVEWTLVDSVAKKCAAMTSFAQALGLGNVVVIADRAETLGRERSHRERYDLVTARACAALPVLAEYALPLLRVGGHLVAWKGPLSATDDEVVRGTRAAALLGGNTPRIDETHIAALGSHRLVVIEKASPTPDSYPRRPGEPARRPLA